MPVNTVGITGIGEFRQDAFESPYLFIKRRKRSLIAEQGVIVKSALFYLLVLVAQRSLLETHAGLVKLLLLQITQTQVVFGILRQRIAFLTHLQEILRRLFVFFGHIMVDTNAVSVRTQKLRIVPEVLTVVFLRKGVIVEFIITGGRKTV